MGLFLIVQLHLMGTPMFQDSPAPELEGGKEWFNTDCPIRLADLKGKIVLLDFWTYC